MTVIKRILISVSNKEGITDFARSLSEYGPEILSTGGTAKALSEAGVKVREVSDFTGFPEILDGRVKTLHPKVHGAILGRRDLKSHLDQMSENSIEPIDMVVVNLYPFEATIVKPGVTLEEAIENIDIGGPAMIRSAAKNFKDVAVIVDPSDYDEVIEEIKANNGALTQETRLKLSAKAYAHTAWYDGRIADHLHNSAGLMDKLPDRKIIQLEKVQTMRYGENPHQQAAFYKTAGSGAIGVAGAKQMHGKELSFNNIVDMSAAYELACEFSDPCVAIIKHTNPCGVALNESLVQAYIDARETDPLSAFGGVIAVNRELDETVAKQIAALFVEVVIAPGFSEGAISALTAKKNVRLITAPKFNVEGQTAVRFIPGGALMQDADAVTFDPDDLKVVSKREPTEDELSALKFAWIISKHVKSNAIIYARDNMTVGIGAGQMSRVDSARIAVEKATRPVEGSVMASDAFFPFRDGIDAAGKVGVRAVIQPGGSVRDEEVISAADEYDMAMVFTGIRHFRH
ncbi:MAG TPA: bifunctional phosphoribosylaminoimidazolecarboxamide formyltransferase/IMP cyclohydrolase [Nitrospirae bacterium]|nr:bifunctional phosphoribosylaminoimidazolecarboxamide formyltransferase/IMP cyclohydrolase [Nitrospirota bacterium]